ncbi:phosphotransferase family enzyme [Actinocorallia herbida]|uniref:Phosphotransferase family enzyme n=1 Tax=Actinocorallia herbida TaxID=58109 RepID=A0A3N1D3H9_9ACTN|nr:phosphotransferase family enzyme [Actinocorallia herbida]
MVAQARRHAGLAASRTTLIHRGENILVGADDAVIRIGRVGEVPGTTREVAFARWLEERKIPAVRPLPIEQPIEVEGHPVTFWERLPAHRQARPAEIGEALRRLHAAAAPDIGLPRLDPFARLPQRISAATTLTDDDRRWLTTRLSTLREQWNRQGLDAVPHSVIHGDIWAGNVVVLHGTSIPIMLDFERCSVGPAAWDLTSIAIKRTSFAWITDDEYMEFTSAVGDDVTASPHYDLLRDVRELRMTCYLGQHAAENPGTPAAQEAELRLQCLRGTHGPRPWPWTPAAT